MRARLARPRSPSRAARGRRPARPHLVRPCKGRRSALTVGCRMQAWLKTTEVAHESATPGGPWRYLPASGKGPNQDGSDSPTRARASGLQDAPSTARSEADTVVRDAAQSLAGSWACSRSGSQPPTPCEDTHMAQWQCDDCGHDNSEIFVKGLAYHCQQCGQTRNACPECGDAAGFASCLYDDVVGDICLSCGYERNACPGCGVAAGFAPCLYDDVTGEICLSCGYEIMPESQGECPAQNWTLELSMLLQHYFIPELMQRGDDAAQSKSEACAESSPIDPLLEVHSKHLTPHAPAASLAAPLARGQLHPKHVRASRAAPPPTCAPSAPTSPWARAVPALLRTLGLVLGAAAVTAGLLLCHEGTVAKDSLAMQRSAIAGTRQPSPGAGKRLITKVSKRMFPLLGSASTSKARRQLYCDFDRGRFYAKTGAAAGCIGPS